MPNQIEVLIIGSHEDSLHEGYKRIEPISSSVTLIQTEKHNILVDTGYYHMGSELLARLEKKGLKPKDIHYVVNTHFHFDHCANNYLFPHADIVTYPAVWHYEKGGIEYYFDTSKYQIPGIELVPTPGHEMVHSSVFVKVEGKVWCMGGDGIGYKVIMVGDYPGYFNKKLYLENALMMLERSDYIIPGHGKIIEGKAKADLLAKVKELLSGLK